MKISQNQIDILKSLKCQRLKDDEKNMYLVEEFSNSINDDIAQTLRNEAFKEVESNSVAYYVVKHPNGQILFFFSLKCGLLFDYFINPELLNQLQKLSEDLKDITNEKSLTPKQQQDVNDVLEKIRASKGITKDDLHK